MSRKYDLEYLNSLIRNRIEESLHIEYKAAEALGRTDSKKKEISKDVSAFANSAGGVIIYGIREFSENDKRHMPERIDPVKRDQFSKEWLDQVINSGIHPKIRNIVITPVTISDTEVVYIVKIPQSDTVHQASDKRYYKRYNFESVAMDDYEVKDIMNRAKSPRIMLEFEIEINTVMTAPPPASIYTKPDNYEYSKKEVTLNVFAHNHGSVYAEFVNFFVYLPLDLMMNNGNNNHTNNGNYQKIERNGEMYILYKGDNTERDVVDYNILSSLRMPQYGAARYSPILPGLRKLVARIPLQSELQTDKNIKWIVYADNSKPIEDKTRITDIQVNDMSAV